MSKSLGNIINPYDVFNAVGADALRWHFTARVAPDVQKRVSVEIIADVASSFINTFWNTYAFFVMYARLDGFDRNERRSPYEQRPEIDRWILSLLEQTIATATAALDDYDALRAGAAIETLRRPAQQLVRAAQPAAFLEGRERRRQAGRVPHALRVPRGRQSAAGAVRAVHQRGGAPEPRARDRAGGARQRAHGDLAGERRARGSTARCSRRPTSCSASSASAAPRATRRSSRSGSR